MQIYYKFSTIVLLLAAIAGCSTLEFPWAYKVTVPQGNYIEHEMVEQLEVGMTKRQVRYVMGSPLIEDTFNTNQWDYYYNIKRGSKTLKEQHFTVFFEEDKLVRWEGTYEPAKKSSDKTPAKEDSPEPKGSNKTEEPKPKEKP